MTHLMFHPLLELLGDVRDMPLNSIPAYGRSAAMDITEDDQHVYLAVDAPGVPRDALTVDIHDGLLTIAGERTVTSADAAHARLRERSTGRFERHVRISRDITAEHVAAELTDGVLRLTITKPSRSEPQRIEIAGAGVDGVSASDATGQPVD